MDSIERKFRNVSQNKLAITNKPPSIFQMNDGEQVIAKEAGKNPKLYIKLNNTLYFNEFIEVSKGS
jgi:hypothetical protein